MANNLTKGESVMAGKTLNDNVPLFSQMFEIGRRYKIMNPSKMRDTYGKLMFILMDTESYHIKNDLKLNFIRPIQTVGYLLEQKGAAELLSDPLLYRATRSVDDSSGGKTKSALASEAQDKSAAAKEIVQRYASPTLTEADIQRVLDSISDNEAYLTFNVQPVDRAIQLLTTYFNPRKLPENENHSLELTSRPRQKTFSSFSFSG